MSAILRILFKSYFCRPTTLLFGRPRHGARTVLLARGRDDNCIPKCRFLAMMIDVRTCFARERQQFVLLFAKIGKRWDIQREKLIYRALRGNIQKRHLYIDINGRYMVYKTKNKNPQSCILI